MTQDRNSSSSGNKPYNANLAGSAATSTAKNSNQVEQAYLQSSAQAGTEQNASLQQNTAFSSQQQNTAQQMAYETGLDFTSDVIRQGNLKAKNQKAANNLVDRMYWQREESLSKSIEVNDKGELEDYDDTPGLGTDKPGV